MFPKVMWCELLKVESSKGRDSALSTVQRQERAGGWVGGRKARQVLCVLEKLYITIIRITLKTGLCSKELSPELSILALDYFIPQSTREAMCQQ